MNEVREAGAESMGTLLKLAGERSMLPFLENLDKIKENRIREYCEKAEVKSVATAKPASSKKSTQVGLTSWNYFCIFIFIFFKFHFRLILLSFNKFTSK